MVKVRKRNPKTSNIDEVRLEPRPPLEMKTANEAKHWVATYALYRVRLQNAINLHYLLTLRSVLQQYSTQSCLTRRTEVVLETARG